MRFLYALHAINKIYTPQEVWFLAIILFFLPLAAALPFLLLLFVIISMTYRFFLRRYHSKGANRLLMLLGFSVLIIDNSRVFSTHGVMHAASFVAFITSLLTYGVTITIIEKHKSKLQNITPVLFWILSFFYNDTLGMLLYSLFALFTVTSLIISMQSKQSLFSVIKPTAILFISALPVALILFFIFPRISSAEFDIGFKQSHHVKQGFDGKSTFSDAALTQQSDAIVMEVSFDQNVPSDNLLYFRGSVLTLFHNYEWLSAPHVEKISNPGAYLTDAAYGTNYTVTLYPTRKKWLFALDIGIWEPNNTTTNLNFVTQSEAPLFRKKTYRQFSYLYYSNHAINDAMRKLSLATNRFDEPRTKALSYAIKHQHTTELQRLFALMQFFADHNFTYTLKPSAHGIKQKIDTFLFDTKDGYCVHYASAFVIMARYMGIPAQMVTGYKAKRKNSIDNFLLVRESDAHAWAEAYVEGKGWVRFDPTSLISTIDWDSFAQVPLNSTGSSLDEYTMEQNRLYIYYLKHLLERYVLQFNAFDQLYLLTLLQQHVELLLLLITLLSLITGIVALIVIRLNRPAVRDRRKTFLLQVYKELKKKGFSKAPEESAKLFIERVAPDCDNPTFLKKLALYCETIQYAPNDVFDTALAKYYLKTLKSVRNLPNEACSLSHQTRSK